MNNKTEIRSTLQNPIILTEEELGIIKRNFGKITMPQIVDLLPRRFRYKWLLDYCRNKLGLTRDKSLVKLPTKNTYNQSYFKELNLNSCYLAGHIAADAALMKVGPSYKLCLFISSSDECIADMYIKEFNFSGKKKFGMQKCSLRPDKITTTGFCRLDFHCFDENAKYLKQYYNIGLNKTDRLEPTNLSNKMLNFAYIMGYWDGDGTISVCHNKKKGYKTVQFSVVSCSKPIIQWIKDIFDKYFAPMGTCARDCNIIYREKYHTYYFGINGLRAAVIINYLRKFPVPKLTRKWENPEVLAYIEDKKREHPELFIEPDPAELAALMPAPQAPAPQFSLPPL